MGFAMHTCTKEQLAALSMRLPSFSLTFPTSPSPSFPPNPFPLPLHSLTFICFCPSLFQGRLSPINPWRHSPSFPSTSFFSSSFPPLPSPPFSSLWSSTTLPVRNDLSVFEGNPSGGSKSWGGHVSVGGCAPGFWSVFLSRRIEWLNHTVGFICVHT